MWSREGIKNNAKDFLRYNYWKAFLVCLILTIVIVSKSKFGVLKQSNVYNDNQTITEISNKNPIIIDNPIIELFTINKVLKPMFYMSKFTFIISNLLIMLFHMILKNTLEVGKVRFFLRGFEGEASIKYLFSTFKGDEFFSIFKTQFLKNIYVFLWSLLLIIPGIIKTYEYIMVPYILADNPNMPSNDAIALSKNITNGHKMDIFVLQISFLGWYFLGIITCGIGVLLVNPYKEATFASLYNILSGNDVKDEKILINDMYE